MYGAVAELGRRTAVLARGALEQVARDARHRIGRRAWLVLYVFVAIQAAWVLRPFVGRPDLPSQFLRDDPWSNAYVVVARYVWAAWRHAVGAGL